MNTINQKKLKDYSLTGSIHTVSVKSPGTVEDIQEEVAGCIDASTHTKGGETTTSKINVNKLDGDIFTYGEFEAAFDTILAGAGIEDYSIIRADMRFDNYDPDHYQRFAKLNRYLISALAVTYSMKNTYKTDGLFSQKQVSVAVKNRYFECENYDKNAESGGTDVAQARLEERSKCKCLTAGGLEKEFTDKWFARWDKAIKNLDKVQKTYNDNLEKIYRENRNAYPVRFRSLTDFLIQYQDCIFTRAQLVDLLSRFPDEVTDPKKRADNHKRKYGVEFFSKSDVQTAVGEIKRATRDFFAVDAEGKIIK